MGKKVGFYYHRHMAKHFLENGHPERPARADEIVARLESNGLMAQLKSGQFDIADEVSIRSVHSEIHIEKVRGTQATALSFLDQGDTYANADSYAVAKMAVGACLRAGEQVFSGELDRAFCCIRPPGHHAERARPMGFCLFNNVAVLSRYLQEKCGLHRIAIIDWDVHHGNGTQEVFYDDPSVFYFSVHQYPFYPGTGSESETGDGAGLGTTLNCPVSAGSGDEIFRAAIDDVCLPALASFGPEFMIISAGFDAHKADPLGDCLMTSQGFAVLTQSLVDFADSHCKGRLVSVLEGGYDLDALSESAERHLEVMLG